ncbi:hypothetical protein TNCT_402931 [Trichonephila clavata]|uniref:Uncharacterized protein n=1 Tax=Trichonephila clavata TaxID=2740835 RepID=A0A8X6JPE1_TRICU|nr:hypothetical protein TNCT_402931 [Trichonephila clavata]
MHGYQEGRLWWLPVQSVSRGSVFLYLTFGGSQDGQRRNVSVNGWRESLEGSLRSCSPMYEMQFGQRWGYPSGKHYHHQVDFQGRCSAGTNQSVLTEIQNKGKI